MHFGPSDYRRTARSATPPATHDELMDLLRSHRNAIRSSVGTVGAVTSPDGRTRISKSPAKRQKSPTKDSEVRIKQLEDADPQALRKLIMHLLDQNLHMEVELSSRRGGAGASKVSTSNLVLRKQLTSKDQEIIELRNQVALLQHKMDTLGCVQMDSVRDKFRPPSASAIIEPIRSPSRTSARSARNSENSKSTSEVIAADYVPRREVEDEQKMYQTKMRRLMASIDKLKAENMQLHREGREHARSALIRHLRTKVHEQEIAIDLLLKELKKRGLKQVAVDGIMESITASLRKVQLPTREQLAEKLTALTDDYEHASKLVSSLRKQVQLLSEKEPMESEEEMERKSANIVQEVQREMTLKFDSERRSLEQQIAVLEAELKSGEKHRASLTKSLEAIQSRSPSVDVDALKRKWAEKKERLTSALEAAKNEATDNRIQYERAMAELKAAQSQLEWSQNEVSEGRTKLAHANETIAQLQAELSQLEVQKHVVDDLRLQLEAMHNQSIVSSSPEKNYGVAISPISEQHLPDAHKRKPSLAITKPDPKPAFREEPEALPVVGTPIAMSHNTHENGGSILPGASSNQLSVESGLYVDRYSSRSLTHEMEEDDQFSPQDRTGDASEYDDTAGNEDVEGGAHGEEEEESDFILTEDDGTEMNQKKMTTKSVDEDEDPLATPSHTKRLQEVSPPEHEGRDPPSRLPTDDFSTNMNATPGIDFDDDDTYLELSSEEDALTIGTPFSTTYDRTLTFTVHDQDPLTSPQRPQQNLHNLRSPLDASVEGYADHPTLPAKLPSVSPPISPRRGSAGTSRPLAAVEQSVEPEVVVNESQEMASVRPVGASLLEDLTPSNIFS